MYVDFVKVNPRVLNQNKRYRNKIILKQNNLDEHCYERFFYPGFNCEKDLFTFRWQSTIEIQKKWEKFARQAYKKHNAYVMATVPSDKLLVWNLKVSIVKYIILSASLRIFRTDGSHFASSSENRFQMNQSPAKMSVGQTFQPGFTGTRFILSIKI